MRPAPLLLLALTACLEPVAAPGHAGAVDCGALRLQVRGDACEPGACKPLRCPCANGTTRSLSLCSTAGCVRGVSCEALCALPSPELAAECVVAPPVAKLVENGGACEKGSQCQSGLCEQGRCVAAPSCKPKGCAEQGLACGAATDGCGKALECGGCPGGRECREHACSCVPRTCAGLGKNCGQLPDGCGGTLRCGSCKESEACGGGGVPNVCGCRPTTCARAEKNCGVVPNGCGGSLFCGSCSEPFSCGGGGTANVCGCTPITCESAGKNCGNIPNGCGGFIHCGLCPAPLSCAGGGVQNICGCTGSGKVMHGPEHALTISSVGGAGTRVWSAPQQALFNDGLRAAVSSLLPGERSQELRAVGFKLAVPANATITGVQLTLNRAASVPQRLRDASVRLWLPGAPSAKELARPGFWPAADGTVTYGGEGELWGEPLTPAVVNDPSFGASISVQHTGTDEQPHAFVDFMQLTVFYLQPCP